MDKRAIIMKLLQAQQDREAHLRSEGYYLPHIQTEHQGKRARAVGNRLYFRRLGETFHEFLIDVILGDALGRKWTIEQGKLSASDQHFIVQCYVKYEEWRERNKTEKNKEGDRWGALPDGWTRSLISLAFDFYCLLHRAKLPTRLINRLKSKDQYQGARYEIAIAALFTRLGFKIEFLDGKKKVGRRCEFIASHEEKRVAIGVETKSRHRRGVLHFKGEASEVDLLRGDVRGLLEDAMGQRPGDLPFMVFIDLNAPLTPDVAVPSKPWFADLRTIIDSFGANSPDSPDEFNAIFVTNFSYHYEKEDESGSGEYIFVVPKYATHPLSDPKLLGLIQCGLNGYGNVPDLV